MAGNQAKIEGLLFVSGNEGITLTELSQITGLLKPSVKEYLKLISEKYRTDRTCSLKILQVEERVRLVTKESLFQTLKKYFESPAMTTLSNAALDTLAIVAYKQPITRLMIDKIRGVQSSAMLQKLQLLNLITESGRLDEPGRPILYGTTEEFLNYFGIDSLDKLPKLDEIEVSDEKEDLLDLFNRKIGEEDE